MGGIAGYFLGIKIARVGMTTFLNTFAFAIPYVHAFGRIGCFCAGCCYGIEYHDFLSISGRFPVQLLESFLLFTFAFSVLIFLCRHADIVSVPVPLFIFYILYYSIIRFFLEFLRADEIRGQISFGASSRIITLSISQVVSVILFTVTLALLIFLLIKNRKTDKLKKTEIQND